LVNEFHSQVSDSGRWPALVPANGGPIDFAARKAGVRGRADAIVRALIAAAEADCPPPELWLDTLDLDGGDRGWRDVSQAGFALAAGGVGNRFFDKYYEAHNPGPATIARVIARSIGDYAVAALIPGRLITPRAAHLFTPTHARVVIDGAKVPTRTHGAALHAGAFEVNLGGVVVRVFPRARATGVLHFQAGEISPAEVIANLPALVAGGAIRSNRLCDLSGREMLIEAQDQPLSPVVDGERFFGIVQLAVRPGPRVRIAKVGAATWARPTGGLTPGKNRSPGSTCQRGDHRAAGPAPDDMRRPPSRSSWLDGPEARGPGDCGEFASARSRFLAGRCLARSHLTCP
jgi:hypothetical protein